MKYRVDFTEELSEKQLRRALQELALRSVSMLDDRAYFYGKNTKILSSGSNNSGIGARVPIPYGRKIVNTVAGYMFAPGAITYDSENERQLEMLRDVFYWNNEKTRNLVLGRNAAIYGYAAELLYDGTLDGKVMPKFRSIEPYDILPIYSGTADDDLVAAVHYYTMANEDTGKPEAYCDVYYPDIVQTWAVGTGMKPVFAHEGLHGYGDIPVVIYWNNEEGLGDFAPIKGIIDAYDILGSDTINEVEKWSLAYLAIVGASLQAQDAAAMKERRIIELPKEAEAFFLTKNIDANFLEFSRKLIREEIHRQSHIPDMGDEQFAGNQSGVSLKYKLMDMENICVVKEAFFRDGLFRRLSLIDGYMDQKIGDLGTVREVDIHFKRNTPENIQESIQAITQARGHISLETLLRTFAKFIDDPKAEIETLRQEELDGMGLTPFEPGEE